VRRKFTAKRPFRCFNCKWRGWIDDAADAMSSAGEADIPVELLAQDDESGHHSPHRH
jgi:hypothetical protein